MDACVPYVSYQAARQSKVGKGKRVSPIGYNSINNTNTYTYLGIKQKYTV